MNNLYDRHQKPLFIVEDDLVLDESDSRRSIEELKTNIQEIVAVEYDGVELGYTPLSWVDLTSK